MTETATPLSPPAVLVTAHPDGTRLRLQCPHPACQALDSIVEVYVVARWDPVDVLSKPGEPLELVSREGNEAEGATERFACMVCDGTVVLPADAEIVDAG